MAKEDTLEHIINQPLHKLQVMFIKIRNKPNILTLHSNNMEDKPIERTMIRNEILLKLNQQIFTIGQQIDTLQGQINAIAFFDILVQVMHIRAEADQHFEEGLVVVGVVLFGGVFVFVDCVDF